MDTTILIADDEPLAKKTLRQHLTDLGCSGTIHEAVDGRTAVSIANREHPQLIFLDIVMPGLSGLQVLERLEYDAKVIFTTAHDNFAVSAFELGALDYVLKPFGRDRLRRVIERVEVAPARPNISLISRAQETPRPARALSKIFVHDGCRIVPIELAAIERIQGADDYATIITVTKEYLVGLKLTDLEHHLASAQFVRVHRSHLINLEYVMLIEPTDGGRLRVVLRSGARIVASRAGSRRLRELAL
jgi:two-component system LytT family response regulator